MREWFREELQKVNWPRVWLAVLIGWVIIVFGSCTINGIMNS